MTIGPTGSGKVSLARQMARSVLALDLGDFGPEVVAKAKLCLLDFLSCAFEAGQHPWSRQAVAIAQAGGTATIIGTSQLSSSADAAFANAVMGHGLVREDMHAASVAHREADMIGGRGEIAIADLRGDELRAHFVDEAVESLLLDGVHVDLQQQMRAAAQIETERNLMAQKARPLLERRRRKSVWQCEEEAEEAYAENQRQLPSLEIKHCSDLARGIAGGLSASPAYAATPAF